MNEPTNNPRLVYNESALLVFSGATYAHEGPEVTTDCPVCQEKRTSFSTELFAHSIWLLLLRLWTFNKLIATCSNCQNGCRIKSCDLELLKITSPEHLATLLVPLRYQPWTWRGRLWVTASLLTCWFPVLGLIVLWITWRKTRYMISGLSNAIMIAAGFIGLLMTSSIVIGLTFAWLTRRA